MKNRKQYFLLLGFLALLVPAMNGCSSAEEIINLRVLNCEDYIGSDIVEEFEEEWNDSHPGKSIKVIYDTFDTNETMLSSLKTGKSVYDLICPSDYAIQKMMYEGMLEPYDYEDKDHPLDNYLSYASPYLLDQLKGIKAEVPTGDGTYEEHSVYEYGCGYMWGTLGILYNPSKVADDKGIEEDQVKFDMQSWSSLWDHQYNLEMSIKDSMRDTYSVGIMYTYEDDIVEALNNSNCFDESFNLKEGCFEKAVSDYNPILTDIFNRCDKEHTLEVEHSLLELKENVFGFEVDSGKDDMVKGLVGINLAWSGDAVYAIDRAENERDNTVYYSVPKTGGNIWFDGWVMPKSNDLHKGEAQDFINFISNPERAVENMDETGYTSFIGGQYVLDLVRSWYDPRSYAMYAYHDASNDPDCTWEDSDFLYDEEDNYVLMDGSGGEMGEYDMRGSTYEAPVCKDPSTGLLLASTWEEYQQLIEEEWLVTDLTYMFENSLDDESPVDGNTPETNSYLFYNDELEEIEWEGESVLVGRQFYTQYPDQTLIPKLAVMKDFGTNNNNVLQLWENVKANNLPIWAVITFGSILIIAIVGIGVYLNIKNHYKKVRISRMRRNSENRTK